MYLSFSPLALTGRIGNCASVAPGSPSGCVTGVRHGTVHADSRHAFEDSLETPEEGAAVQGAGRGGETTPKPRRNSRSKKVCGAACGLSALTPQTLQTPMPETGCPNDFGPPPPESTPNPERGKSCYQVGPQWRMRMCGCGMCNYNQRCMRKCCCCMCNLLERYASKCGCGMCNLV